MYKRYVDTNVDFERLKLDIKMFFEQRGFKTEEHTESGRHNIVAKIRGLPEAIEITLEGSPENFVVEGTFAKDQPTYKISSMFGGGFLLLREIERYERLLKLEKEFSNHLENAVAELTNTYMHQ